jgi:hypothetical protein
MRHRRARLQATFFCGGELRWMMTGTFTLVVLFMLMTRLREPGALGWLAGLKQTPSQTTGRDALAPLPPAAALPQATGPTDEDPDQAETAREEFQAMTDGALGLGPEEQIPYDRLVFWVKNQPFARLWARGQVNPAYTYLYDQADRHRGLLASLDVNVRIVRKVGKNEHGVPLSEVWATTKQSGDRLYDLIVVDLPAEIPLDTPIQEPAKFAGYFLKLQGYHPALSKPGVAPERAPLLIGRIEWTQTRESSAADSRQEWIWGSLALGIIVVVLAVRFAMNKLKPRPDSRRGILTPPSDAVIPVELWLEHSGFASQDDRQPDNHENELPSSENGP